MYGPRFAAALDFACAKHHGQRRKGAGSPYITHPLAVASLIGDYGGDEDQAIAGLLHDVMEDCEVERQEIAERFGDPVADIVAACTDTTQKPKPPWRPRKEAYIAHLRDQPPHTKLVVACDKLHNAQSIDRDRQRSSVGEAVWTRFSAARGDVLWYYGAVCEALAHGWSHELLDELTRTVARLR
ncbi:MAG: HD domain-containing protein [Deltaproteobacteria bacterium]|nr:HD domain-containing protein [Deltaproteobacteria bacterium]